MTFMYNLMSSNISVLHQLGLIYTITDCGKPIGTREINGTSDASRFSDARIAAVFCLQRRHVVEPTLVNGGIRGIHVGYIYVEHACNEYTLIRKFRMYMC